MNLKINIRRNTSRSWYRIPDQEHIDVYVYILVRAESWPIYWFSAYISHKCLPILLCANHSAQTQTIFFFVHFFFTENKKHSNQNKLNSFVFFWKSNVYISHLLPDPPLPFTWSRLTLKYLEEYVKWIIFVRERLCWAWIDQNEIFEPKSVDPIKSKSLVCVYTATVRQLCVLIKSCFSARLSCDHNKQFFISPNPIGSCQ